MRFANMKLDSLDEKGIKDIYVIRLVHNIRPGEKSNRIFCFCWLKHNERMLSIRNAIKFILKGFNGQRLLLNRKCQIFSRF